MAVAEIFGNGGETVTTSGEYECSQCGHRVHLEKGQTFPPDHHAQKPWTLYVRSSE